MCGIVGYIGSRSRDAVPVLMDGLKRLDYRGYDSAGVAVADAGVLRVKKAAGSVRDLETQLPAEFTGSPGIGHTRWATHGEATERNAHPHCDAAGRFAVVHNGIIENAAELRARLQATGTVFRSDTDSEVLVHLIAAMCDSTLERAVRGALRLVIGTYGLAVMDAQQPEILVVARNGSPVLVGIGEHEMFVASDAAALVRYTQTVVHLDDGEIAVISAESFETSNLDGGAVSKTPSTIACTGETLDKGKFPHHMRKEIAEQPDALRRTLAGRLERRLHTSHLGGVDLDAHELLQVRRVKILGCGSAYIAGCLGAQLIEQLARIPAHAEAASEFRYRNPVIERDTLYIAVSQSGETFDTLAAVQELKRKGGRVLGIVNSVGSSIARECGRGIYIHAGPEVSVVSTKAFTCTAAAFALLALHMGRIRDLAAAQGDRLLTALTALPQQVEDIIAREHEISRLARRFETCEHMYFVGRAAGYAVAMEGALKVKEVSYVHAEAYAASELKHGPLALISAETPTVLIMPQDELYQKSMATLEEIRSRRGPVFVVTHPDASPPAADGAFEIPRSEPELDPILLNIPLQLLAYHIGLQRGRNIDRPRNLAKSVTVE